MPDLLLPFAAISENGRDIGLIDGLAELAHRTMLTNVVRLLGAIKSLPIDATKHGLNKYIGLSQALGANPTWIANQLQRQAAGKY